MIYRTILDELKAWKDSPDRKPLLLKGARQIGKTWAMERFGSDNFEFTAKFDFDETQELCGVFERTRDVGRLLKELALYTDVPLEAGGWPHADYAGRDTGLRGCLELPEILLRECA